MINFLHISKKTFGLLAILLGMVVGSYAQTNPCLGERIHAIKDNAGLVELSYCISTIKKIDKISFKKGVYHIETLRDNLPLKIIFAEKITVPSGRYKIIFLDPANSLIEYSNKKIDLDDENLAINLTIKREEGLKNIELPYVVTENYTPGMAQSGSLKLSFVFDNEKENKVSKPAEKTPVKSVEKPVNKTERPIVFPPDKVEKESSAKPVQAEKPKKNRRDGVTKKPASGPSKTKEKGKKTKSLPTLEPPDKPLDTIAKIEEDTTSKIKNPAAAAIIDTTDTITPDNVEKPAVHPNPNLISNYWPLAVAAALFLLAGMLFFRKKTKITEENVEDNNEAPIEIEETESNSPTEEVLRVMQTPKIKIKGIKKASLPENFAQEAALEQQLHGMSFLDFELSLLWADSVIKRVYFKEKPAEALDYFLRKQTLTSFQEQDGQIPEIGGILLGTPFYTKDNKGYKVLVEEFVPISPEHHDVYRLEFSTTSLARDLGNIQDEYPDLILVGWFHTHPGHGLFLSQPDLRVQNSFFKAPYQFAMEIDSLTTYLNTAFFSRMNNGEINNRNNLKEQADWFSWLEAKAAIKNAKT